MMFVSLTPLFFINCTSDSAIGRKIIFCEDSYPNTIKKIGPKRQGRHVCRYGQSVECVADNTGWCATATLQFDGRVLT